MATNGQRYIDKWIRSYNIVVSAMNNKFSTIISTSRGADLLCIYKSV